MKKIRRSYFGVREIRLSIAIIVLWSFLAVTLLTFGISELLTWLDSSQLTPNHVLLIFLLIMLGYGILVVIFTLFFAKRLIGPFERLKKEIRLILKGEYHRRLSVRNSDDVYIRSLIKEINILLDDYEKMYRFHNDLTRSLNSELLDILSELEKDELSKDQLREALLSFHDKLKSQLEQK